MNKKAIIICLIALLIVISGLFYVIAQTRVQKEVPYINSNLQSGNNNYNSIVADLNSSKYSQALQKTNETLNNYAQAKEHAQVALNRSTNENDTILEEYFNYTIEEINLKIDAVYEIRSGINVLNPNDLTISKQHFDESNQLMQDSIEYSNKRNQLEKQYPNKFKQ